MFRLDIFLKKKIYQEGVQDRLLGKEAIHHRRTLDKCLADPAAGQEKGLGDLPRHWALTGIRQTRRESMFSVRLKLRVFCCPEKDRAQGGPSLYEEASMYFLTNSGSVSHRFLSQKAKGVFLTAQDQHRCQ